jgi:AhpD family alkylhydroperoxidase
VTERQERAMTYGKHVQAELAGPSRALRERIPAVYKGYSEMSRAAVADGALDTKTKELMALAIAVTKQCDGCIASHARGAAARGATPEEVAETLGVVVMMNGGPGTVHAPRAFAAFQEFAGDREGRT